MIVLILCIVAIVIGIYLIREHYSDFGDLGGFLFIIGCVVMFINGVVIVLNGYNYNELLIERYSYEDTIEYARKENSYIETSTITPLVLEWNKELANKQFKNTTLFFDWYFDDRIMDIRPLK